MIDWFSIQYRTLLLEWTIWVALGLGLPEFWQVQRDLVILFVFVYSQSWLSLFSYAFLKYAPSSSRLSGVCPGACAPSIRTRTPSLCRALAMALMGIIIALQLEMWSMMAIWKEGDQSDAIVKRYLTYACYSLRVGEKANWMPLQLLQLLLSAQQLLFWLLFLGRSVCMNADTGDNKY